MSPPLSRHDRPDCVAEANYRIDFGPDSLRLKSAAEVLAGEKASSLFKWAVAEVKAD